MAPQPPKIAFAGLGAMGYGMATHLLKSGFPVTGYDVHEPTLARFARESHPNSDSAPTITAREAVQDADFLIIMVATSAQATPLLFDKDAGAVAGLKRNATVLICSTVSPAYIAQLQRILREEAGRGEDVRLIDCPVSGGAGRAAAGTLSVFASGDGEDLERARGVLECMADTGKLYMVGGGLGGGSNAKLVHQIFAGVHIAMASEAMGLAAAGGWDTREAFERLRKGGGSSWMFENRVPPMFDPGHAKYSAISIITKDVGIITSTARRHNHPLPLLATAEQLYLSATSAGWAAEDDCVLVRLYLFASPDAVATQAGNPVRSSPSIRLETIDDLMVGVHTAAVAEAMSFCARLGIDVDLMYNIVSNAAGSSNIFINSFSEMKEAGWKLQGERMRAVRDQLAKAVNEVYELRYPLYLSSAALQEFQRQLL